MLVVPWNHLELAETGPAEPAFGGEQKTLTQLS